MAFQQPNKKKAAYLAAQKAAQTRMQAEIEQAYEEYKPTQIFEADKMKSAS